MKHLKSSVAFGVLACVFSSSAFAATVEQDRALQERGLEYNRQFDLAHGYYNGGSELSEAEFNEQADQIVMQALKEERQQKRIPNQPIMREEIRAKKEAPPVLRPNVVESRKPQWQIDLENDRKRQEEALEYNRRFDEARGYRNLDARVYRRR